MSLLDHKEGMFYYSLSYPSTPRPCFRVEVGQRGLPERCPNFMDRTTGPAKVWGLRPRHPSSETGDVGILSMKRVDLTGRLIRKSQRESDRGPGH